MSFTFAIVLVVVFFLFSFLDESFRGPLVPLYYYISTGQVHFFFFFCAFICVKKDLGAPGKRKKSYRAEKGGGRVFSRFKKAEKDPETLVASENILYGY